MALYERDGPEPNQPERERLHPGEIDYTGAVEQSSLLFDEIGDALIKANDDGMLPDWGARALARHLANHYGKPGALHHYAVMGIVDLDRILDELTDLWVATERRHIRFSIDHLASFLMTKYDTQNPQDLTKRPEKGGRDEQPRNPS